MKTFRSDYHIHSTFSPDGRALPEENIAAALAAGLDSVIFTDHCECNSNAALPPEVTPWPELEVDAYYEKMTSFKDRYPLRVGVGLEIGQPTQGKEYAQAHIEAHDWDFILGSNHNLRGEYDFCFMDYSGRDIDKLCKRYFEELYEVVEWGNFDVLAHLYYFVKYLARADIEVDFGKYNADIADIFRLLIKNGKGLEVNTSCLSDKYGRTVPGYEHLKLFRQLGGELVTIGSDSHYPSRIGSGGDYARELLREAGFEYIAEYRKRKPVMMRF